MFRLFLFLPIFAIQALAQVTIVHPESGVYLSGEYEIKLKIEGDPVRTLFYVDGKPVFQKAGKVEQFSYDFGEEILRRELRAEVEDSGGARISSELVFTRELKIDVTDTARLVLLGAVVKTRRNEAVTGLDQHQFQVLENGVPLEIRTFYREKLPLDLVMMLDTSSSLREGGIEDVRQGAIAFINQLEPGDRVALFEFKKMPHMLADFTTDRQRLTRMIQDMEPLGETALFNALHLGLEHLKGRSKGRKALVLFTDGRDSFYDDPRDKANMMRSAIALAQNGEVTIFTLGLGEKVHKEALERIAEETGGRFYAASQPSRLAATFNDILTDLKNQYILGVTPLANEKGFHRIEIKVKKRGALVHARKGYTLE